MSFNVYELEKALMEKEGSLKREMIGLFNSVYSRLWLSLFD